jgi:hypothetical protein
MHVGCHCKEIAAVLSVCVESVSMIVSAVVGVWLFGWQEMNSATNYST